MTQKASRKLGLLERLCLAVSDVFRGALIDRFADLDVVTERDYLDWLFYIGAQRYSVFYEKFVSAEGKDVLDVGCGLGGITKFYASMKPRKIIGVDINEDRIKRAIRLREDCWPISYSVLADFLVCDASILPFESNSFDLVILDDVFEHLQDPLAAVEECARVVKRSGFICIDFPPYNAPKGHHLGNLVPIPWGHVFFPEKVLLQVAAYVYESPGRYKPSFHHFDLDTGAKKPNPYSEVESLPYLNRMTISKSERIIEASGLKIIHKRLYGFYEAADRKLLRALGLLISPFSRASIFREYFTKAVVYILGL